MRLMFDGQVDGWTAEPMLPNPCPSECPFPSPIGTFRYTQLDPKYYALQQNVAESDISQVGTILAVLGNEANKMNDKPNLANATPKPDRRRSQRTILVMPLALSWTTGTGMRVREHAETEVVSATGAMLRMKTRVPNHGTVEIKRPAANQSATATVVTVSNPGPDGWIRVGVEFTAPNTSFWGINFPPIEAQPVEPMPPAKPTLAYLLAQRDAASRAALSSLAVPLRAPQSARTAPFDSPATLPGALTVSALGVK